MLKNILLFKSNLKDKNMWRYRRSNLYCGICGSEFDKDDNAIIRFHVKLFMVNVVLGNV